MDQHTYYVIKPTTHNRKKVSYGDELLLTESQARPLRNGGFISPDKAAAERIGELVREVQALKAGDTETADTDTDSNKEDAAQ
ncbi:hypothetical protein BTO32_11330 [Marinobacter lutaoensis]|uniref:Uncharacterized protein n=1 Tax=Marinobacter lutaoensis TaxID=135739 RepID=A0A1V2DS11_9GAMM|nr:hypothetical protein [Marinobacter lutaoensis]ONF43270.1 hypothetical protein BTO32_11330 [Marinobacter lutaoensis]